MLYDGRLWADVSQRDCSAQQRYVLTVPVSTCPHRNSHSFFVLLNASSGYGLIATLLIVATTIVGITEYFFIDQDIESFFVGGRSFTALITTMGLGAQAIDSSALLGNADLAYKSGFFDGAAVSIGLALSLILNGLFLADHINQEKVLTLPDVLARRYGPVVETIVSLSSVMTMLMLIAGNLVGFAKVASYLWSTSTTISVWIAAGSVWLIAVSGGLFSAASTSVVQGTFCWGGFVLTVVYIVFRQYQSSSPPSIGFPGRSTEFEGDSSKDRCLTSIFTTVFRVHLSGHFRGSSV
jgi:Na+/proline symporter